MVLGLFLGVLLLLGRVPCSSGSGKEKRQIIPSACRGSEPHAVLWLAQESESGMGPTWCYRQKVQGPVPREGQMKLLGLKHLSGILKKKKKKCRNFLSRPRIN